MQNESVFCPVAGRNVSGSECIEICDVADRLISKRILEDFKPPLEFKNDCREICKKCKYHG